LTRLLVLFAAGQLVTLAGEATAPLEKYTPAERKHWSFQQRKNAVPPDPKNPAMKAWVKTPVDAFILEKLQSQGLRPAPAADRHR